MTPLQYFWLEHGDTPIPTLFTAKPHSSKRQNAMKKLRQAFTHFNTPSIAMRTWLEAFMALPDAPSHPAKSDDATQEDFFVALHALPEPPDEVTERMWKRWFVGHPGHAVIFQYMVDWKEREKDAQS